MEKRAGQNGFYLAAFSEADEVSYKGYDSVDGRRNFVGRVRAEIKGFS